MAFLSDLRRFYGTGEKKPGWTVFRGVFRAL